MNSHNPHFPVRSVIIFGNICLYSGDFLGVTYYDSSILRYEYVGTMQAIYILRGVAPGAEILYNT